MISNISIEHVSLVVKGSFEDFTNNLEEILGLFRPAEFDLEVGDEASLMSRLKNLGGEKKLVLFGLIEHGELLRLKGFNGKAKQYQLGNPNIATQMTAADIRSGLYSPLRMLVYEDIYQRVIIEYDLPSSVFAHLNDCGISEVALALDKKIEVLIDLASTYQKDS